MFIIIAIEAVKRSTGRARFLMKAVEAGQRSYMPVAHKAAFDAAVKAGVQHIVYASTLGADKGENFIAADHKKSEEYLRASGAKWTMLRNGPYMETGQNLEVQFFGETDKLKSIFALFDLDMSRDIVREEFLHQAYVYPK